jgi:hypothetical protein
MPVLALKQPFGATVRLLLPEVRAQRGWSVMSDLGCGREADVVARVKQSPTDIDVVSGCGENGVESIELLQHRLAECHVAPGHVLGTVVRDEDVYRPSRSLIDRALGERGVRWRHIRPAGSR